MSENIDLSYLTKDDYQDYWNQFLRFYAEAVGKNYSKKIPISLLDKSLRQEIIEKYEIQNKWNVSSIVQELIKKGAIEFETLAPKDKFTEKYSTPISKILTKLKSELNPAYNVNLIEEKPNELKLYTSIDIEDWLKLPIKDKETALKIGSKFQDSLKKLLGVEFGSAAYGKVNYYHPYGPSVNNFDTWMKTVMNKKIKKDIKDSPYRDYVLRMKVSLDATKVQIDITSPRYKRYSGNGKEELREFIPQLFEKYGYNPNSVEVTFV